MFSIDELVTKAVMHNKRCYLKLFLQVGHLFLHFSILLLQSFGLRTKVCGLSKEHLRETAADFTLISEEKLFLSFSCLLMLSTPALADTTIQQYKHFHRADKKKNLSHCNKYNVNVAINMFVQCYFYVSDCTACFTEFYVYKIQIVQVLLTAVVISLPGRLN